jgi:hypothetical protein
MPSPELGGGHETTRFYFRARWHGSLAACSAGAAIRTHPGRRCILGLCRCRGSGCEPTEKYSKSIGEARLMVGNIIRMLARAPKSRARLSLRCGHRTARQARRLCSDCMTRSTRLHVFVQHHQHPGQKQKHRGNNGMTPKHEGHPKDCNDESNQCHPVISKSHTATEGRLSG